MVEATFTPYFEVFLDHEDKLFAPGDERVASLFLWHFVEEIEHRSSALLVYGAVHDSYAYWLKTIAGVVKHMSEILSIVSSGFRKHVPHEDGGEYCLLIPNGLSFNAIRETMRASRRLPSDLKPTYAGVPRRDIAEMIVGLVRSQSPKHDPTHEKLPPFADRWFTRYDEDPRSAARWYSVGANSG